MLDLDNFFKIVEIKNTKKYRLVLNYELIDKKFPQELHSNIDDIISIVNNNPDITSVDLGGYALAEYTDVQKKYLNSLFAKIISYVAHNEYITYFESIFRIPDQLLIDLLDYNKQLTHLCISASNLGKKESDLRPLAQAINRHGKLISLELYLENKPLIMILEILRNNKTLKHLSLMNLEINQTYDGVEILKAIKNNNSLESLEVSFEPNLPVNFKEQFCIGVARNKFLQRIELDVPLPCLSHILKFNKSLLTINNENSNLIENLTLTDIENFINNLYVNNTIQKVDLYLCNIKISEYDLLFQALNFLKIFTNIGLFNLEIPNNKIYITDVEKLENMSGKLICIHLPDEPWNEIVSLLEFPQPSKKLKL